MLTVKMDNGSLYEFENYQYDEYDITKDFIVVKRGESWIGVFSREHFVALTVEGNRV